VGARIVGAAAAQRSRVGGRVFGDRGGKGGEAAVWAL
jgi:hypothetical protein